MAAQYVASSVSVCLSVWLANGSSALPSLFSLVVARQKIPVTGIIIINH
jgi:hypothetical protein